MILVVGSKPQIEFILILCQFSGGAPVALPSRAVWLAVCTGNKSFVEKSCSTTDYVVDASCKLWEILIKFFYPKGSSKCNRLSSLWYTSLMNGNSPKEMIEDELCKVQQNFEWEQYTDQ